MEHRRDVDGTIAGEPAVARDDKARERAEQAAIREVRASDIEPYTGLRYLSKLFRFMGVIMVLLLVAEVATGVYTQGSAAIPTLLGEASRLIVLAGVLWGTGDLALLLIDVGHDVRAARILVARVAHHAKVPPLTVTSGPSASASERGGRSVDEVVPLADRPISVARPNTTDSDAEGPPIP